MKHDQTKHRLDRLSDEVALIATPATPEPPYRQEWTKDSGGRPIFRNVHIPSGGVFELVGLTPEDLEATAPKR